MGSPVSVGTMVPIETFVLMFFLYILFLALL